MNDLEAAQRLTAWTWAAQTLGIEVTRERLSGLVSVTAKVRLDNLKPALERVMQTQEQGFLPSPGAVITTANRIAGERMDRAHAQLLAERRERLRIAAVSSPTNPEQMQELRDKIARLAGQSKTGRSGWTKELPTNDQKGLAAARAATHRLRVV